MFNAVHEALSHKGRFALEYVHISTPDCPVHTHKIVVGVAAVENGVVVHKMVPSKDMDFWMKRGTTSRVHMTFPSTLPIEHLDEWKRQCGEHHVGFEVSACAFSTQEQQQCQTIVERCIKTSVSAARKRFAA